MDTPANLTNPTMAAMPSSAAPTNIVGGPGLPSMTQEEMQNPTSPVDPWTDTYAAKIAMADFQRAEAYRSMNHDQRFNVSEQMYLGWKKSQNWEGTKIPRSAVPIFIGLEQVEGLLPSAIGALFPDNNELPFDADPYPGTTVQQATAVKDLLGSQMGDVGEPGRNLSMRELCRRSYKNSLIYGHAPVEFGVLDINEVRTQFQRIDIPIRVPIPHPVTGVPVPVPTGQFKSIVKQFQAMQRIVKPLFQETDIRDYYWDPHCFSHNPNDGAFCATRHLRTVNQLLDLSETEGFNIPSAAELYKLSQIKSATRGDQGKTNQESLRGMTYQPQIDYSSDPGQARVEVIRYWQKGRHVWLFGRQWTAFNKINPYGMLPFLNMFYVDVPGRFAGLSIFDLVEGDQKLAEAIINARIDELNLLIHPPIIKKQGRSFSASQQRLRPGVIWESESPKDDYIRFEMGNITQEAYIEVEALERRVQKKTGVTDLAVLGTPSSGGNSANRTATGVSSQAGASGKRIQYHVENAEDQFLKPALEIMLKLNQIFMPMDQMIQILGPEQQFMTLDPVDILNASVKFKMNASSKMRTRQALATGGLAIIAQTYLNPEVIQMNMQQGKKLDMAQFDRMFNDVFGMPPTAFWVDATQQEMQAYLQMQAMPAMLKRQEQKDRLDSHERSQAESDETELIGKLLDFLKSPDIAHLLINELTGSKLTLPSDVPPQTASTQ